MKYEGKKVKEEHIKCLVLIVTRQQKNLCLHIPLHLSSVSLSTMHCEMFACHKSVPYTQLGVRPFLLVSNRTHQWAAIRPAEIILDGLIVQTSPLVFFVVA